MVLGAQAHGEQLLLSDPLITASSGLCGGFHPRRPERRREKFLQGDDRPLLLGGDLRNRTHEPIDLGRQQRRVGDNDGSLEKARAGPPGLCLPPPASDRSSSSPCGAVRGE